MAKVTALTWRYINLLNLQIYDFKIIMLLNGVMTPRLLTPQWPHTLTLTCSSEALSICRNTDNKLNVLATNLVAGYWTGLSTLSCKSLNTMMHHIFRHILCLLPFHEINSHEISCHQINSHEINSHEINLPPDQLNLFNVDKRLLWSLSS